MENLKETLSLVALMSLFSASANAALSSSALLAFDNGLINCDDVASCPLMGSYYGFDINEDGVFGANEISAISPGSDGGLRVAQTQLAANAHAGSPDGSEVAPLVAPLNFLGNTGMYQTTSPVNIISDNGTGTVDLDFSGFSFLWNNDQVIDLGGDSVNYASEIGVAILNCDIDCSTGDRFTLDYAVHVPMDDSNDFVGTYWNIHLVGTVAEVPAPTALWLFGTGLLSLFGFARRHKPVLI